MRDTIRNGFEPRGQRQDYVAPANPPSAANDENRRRERIHHDRGLHESFDWYDACYNRPRNDGWYPHSIRISFNNVIYA